MKHHIILSINFFLLLQYNNESFLQSPLNFMVLFVGLEVLTQLCYFSLISEKIYTNFK